MHLIVIINFVSTNHIRSKGDVTLASITAAATQIDKASDVKLTLTCVLYCLALNYVTILCFFLLPSYPPSSLHRTLPL